MHLRISPTKYGHFDRGGGGGGGVQMTVSHLDFSGVLAVMRLNLIKTSEEGDMSFGAHG